MRNTIIEVIAITSVFICLTASNGGESSGEWPSSLIHPLTGKAGGTYIAVTEGSFKDAKYNNGVVNIDEWAEHLGTDIKEPNGSKVYAIADGTGITTKGSGTNIAVVVTHEVGGIKFLGIYGHVTLTHTKSTIRKGEVLGKILDYGAAGSKGDHLHFGTFKGSELPGSPWGWGRAPYQTSLKTVTDKGWRDPVPFLRELTTLASPALIEVSGIKAIKNGDTNASTSDGTYLKGRKNQKLRFLFAIRNIGKSPLTINSCVLKNADRGFTITRSPKTTISPGTYSTLEIEFRSSSYGYNYADVEIRSNSDKDATFKYEIKALVSK